MDRRKPTQRGGEVIMNKLSNEARITLAENFAKTNQQTFDLKLATDLKAGDVIAKWIDQLSNIDLDGMEVISVETYEMVSVPDAVKLTFKDPTTGNKEINIINGDFLFAVKIV